MLNCKAIHILSLFLLFTSCEEEAFTLDDSDLSLKIDTVSFDVIESTTYQVPPLMGGSRYLYLGQENDFTFDYNYIRVSKFSNSQYYISTGKTISQFHDYVDSSITIDSVKLFLNFVDDSISSNSLFYLRYFPNVSDSVFSRNNSNYLNYNSNYSNIISYGNIVNDTTSSKLEFLIDTSHFKTFIDTTITDFNNAFAVSAHNTELELYKFFSANNGQSTVSNLFVYFKHIVSDTLTIDTLISHNIVDDLTILTPPTLTESDTLSLSISLAKGLKSLLKIDTKSWEMPKGGIFRKAELVLNLLSSDSSNSEIINSYLLTDSDLPNTFKKYEKENFTYDLSNGSSAALNNNQLKFNHRSALSKSLSEKKSLHSFNIQPNIDVDPFKTFKFYDAKNVEFHPKLRITYVLP